VAADNVNIIKLLPPLNITDAEIDSFVAALDDVLGDAHRSSGLLVEVGMTMAKNHPPSHPGPQRHGCGHRGVGLMSAEPDVTWSLDRDDRVLVTGAAGFIGSALTRELCEREVHVVALVEPGGDRDNLEGLDVEEVTADLRDAAAVAKAADGCPGGLPCRRPCTGSGPRTPSRSMPSTSRAPAMCSPVLGGPTCERVVYTSTVGTLGLKGATQGRPVDETSYAHVDHLFGGYKQSKYVAEHEVLRAAARRAPVMLVQPTMPVGPRDRGPTPTGQTVLEYLNGRIPVFVDTTLNVVDVEDVAHGHVLAGPNGGPSGAATSWVGEENLSLQQILGYPGRSHRFARAHPSGPEWLGPWPPPKVSELIEGRLLRRGTVDTARGGEDVHHPDVLRRRPSSHRARVHLQDPHSTPWRMPARWFAESGAVRPERLARFTWSGGR